MDIFNLTRYRELLVLVEKDAVKTKTGKDFFNDPIVLELLSFESRIETQVFYNNKNNYFALIQQYLDETINPYLFRAQFLEMVKEDLNKSDKILKNFEELSTFWIDLELDEFSSLFEDINETCAYAFEFDGETNAISEDTFRDSIQKIFFKIQKYSDEE
jgi:hypothetical protein